MSCAVRSIRALKLALITAENVSTSLIQPATDVCECNAGYTVLADSSACTYDCVPAPSLTDGSATATSLTAISFTCDNGFDLVGTATINCVDSTGWETGPSCQCPALTAPANGGVDKTSGTTAVGGTATYTCDATYTLSGTNTRNCVSGTGWVGSAPTCGASANDCGSLVNPSNGQVAAPATTEGSMGTYSCNSGYTLVGSCTRTCEASGWNGSEPTCQQDSKADALVFSTWLAVTSTMLVVAMF